MIKNHKILDHFEQQHRQPNRGKEWYKKADALYETAMSLNPEAVTQGGQQHVNMLIRVREKLKLVKKNITRAN